MKIEYFFPKKNTLILLKDIFLQNSLAENMPVVAGRLVASTFMQAVYLYRFSTLEGWLRQFDEFVVFSIQNLGLKCENFGIVFLTT